MVYSTEAAKWKAYQFSDPFAAGSFFVCNKLNRFFCRPDCDARPRTNLKSEIKFTTTAKEAVQYGFIPCESCDPMNSTAIDIGLLIKCVSSVNTKIGFMPPLLDENEDANSKKIKENIMESKRANEVQILKTIGGGANTGRRASMSAASTTGKSLKDSDNASLSKNDSDHYRLVDLACRHLALAAAVNVFQPKPLVPTPEECNSPTGASGSNGNSKKRRRRGGVLGFKELAAKSKLSAWHFHRVFKSVTGLTPKTYGDKCWEFVKKVKESGEYTSFEAYNSPQSQSPKSTTPNSPILKMSSTEAKPPASKKVKIENQTQYPTSSLQSPSLFTTQTIADDRKYAGVNQSLTPPHTAASFNGQFPMHSQHVQPLTPPNQYSSPSISQLNTVQSVIPDAFYPGHHHQPSLDEQLQALPNLDFDLYDEPQQFQQQQQQQQQLPQMEDEDQQQALHTKAFSFPDLSKFRTISLFQNNGNNNSIQPSHHQHHQSAANPSLFQNNDNLFNNSGLPNDSLHLGFEEEEVGPLDPIDPIDPVETVDTVGQVDFNDYINSTNQGSNNNYINQLQPALGASTTTSTSNSFSPTESSSLPSQGLDSVGGGALPQDEEFDFTDAFTQDVFSQSQQQQEQVPLSATGAADSTFSPFDTSIGNVPGVNFNDDLDFTMNPQLVATIID
ncbi:hypothetical protein I9W82_004817 [Candida metapsilosis]|uniref:Ada DNA repair metal-binding domain-containing protein n=1 Tax=Candida metapsilosis TaxID=273372 RepID=A0A8H8D8Z7_9ASCO|nr:hypothetical protein I9W82_004817 [Candida metapsilosis]